MPLSKEEVSEILDSVEQMFGHKVISRPLLEQEGLKELAGGTAEEKVPHFVPLPVKQDRGRSRGLAIANETLQNPPEPTNAQPGSPEKVRIMEERAQAGYNIWHPLDEGTIGRRSMVRR